MVRVKVKLFGVPLVTVNNKNIIFPFKKAEALFYYMVLKKECTRDELISLFWQDQEDEVARKNLRNAIYSVKKSFNYDIFISYNKSLLSINPKVFIDCDVANFLDNDTLEEYEGDFLEGFCVKDCEVFENWVLMKREELKELYKKRLYSKVYLLIKELNFIDAEIYLKKILNLDEFDEKAIRILMQVYANNGEINKAIELYKNIQIKLKKELGILPDTKTRNIYEKIISSRTQNEEKFFYGRNLEISKLLDNYNKFISEMDHKNILIIGEAGIGKTRLIEEFLKIFNKKCIVIKTFCYAVEENYILKPWGDILNGLSDLLLSEDIPKLWKNILVSFFPSLENIFKMDEFINYELNKYQLLEEVIVSLLLNISHKNKLLIIIEDIHWMDSISISILKKLILSNRKNILFMLSSRYDKKINLFYSSLLKYEKIEKIELLRFNEKEVKDFVIKALNGKEVSQAILNNVYKETEGITFFLVEYTNLLKNNSDINSFNAKMHEILNSRFIDISDEARRILAMISMFYDEAPFEYLKELSNKDEEELFEILDELMSKYIIIETNSKNISYKFTHQKLREFIYNNQSIAKRKILHSKIARLIEKRLNGDKDDIYLYKGLIYHFKGSGDVLSALKYELKNICEFLNFSNELFPEINFDLNNFDELNKKSIYKKLIEIENQLNKIKDDSEDFQKNYLLFCYIKGRYCIWEGNYEKGVDYIQQAIELSKAYKDDELLLKSIRQMINYSIQVYDVELMTRYVEEGIRIASRLRNKKEMAVLLRLKGLNLIMLERFLRAEEVLKHSLMILEELNNKENKYFLNIAASLNYLGNIKRLNTNFKAALNYYDKAIEMCNKANTNIGLTVFLTNAGLVAYEMGDYTKSKEYLTKAVKIYKNIGAYWLRAVAEGYLSLTLIKEGRYDEALKYFKSAELNSEKLKSPYEKGIIFRVKAEIKRNMENNQKLKKVFENHLTQNINFYCQEGIKCLERAKERYQVDTLKTLSRG